MEKETYEIICEDCGKLFDSEDSEATLCPECWEKAVGANLEGEGLGEDK